MAHFMSVHAITVLLKASVIWHKTLRKRWNWGLFLIAVIDEYELIDITPLLPI